jgi:hypothetical protein
MYGTSNPAISRPSASTHHGSNSAARPKAHGLTTSQTSIPETRLQQVFKQSDREQKRPRLLAPQIAQLSIETSGQADQSVQQAIANPPMEFTGARRYARCVPQICLYSGDGDHRFRQPEYPEQCSEQSSDGFKTAAENMPEERGLEGGAEMQPCRADAPSSEIAGDDINDGAEINQNHLKHRDDDQLSGRDSD